MRVSQNYFNTNDCIFDQKTYFLIYVSFMVIMLTATMTIDVAAKNLDILIADFESEDYGNWNAEGEAFGPEVYLPNGNKLPF